jgi:hypothetical protein
MQQLDLFETDVSSLVMEILKLKEDLVTLRRGAFYQISALRKELVDLTAHCEVMSDELFEREEVS